MSALKLDGPMNILVLLGLTLPELSDPDGEKIRAAAAPGSRIRVVSQLREALDQAQDIDVILGFLPEPLFHAAPGLRWVHAIASGVDAFLYPAMRDSEVVLTGEKGLVGGHLADTGFGLLLALTRQIATAIRLGSDSWDARETMRRREIELEGLTMGIIGFGGTGRAMARRATAFGMRVLALDEWPVSPSDGVQEVWGRERLADLLASSDVVAVCCPLTAQTRHLLNDTTLGQLKRGAFVLNITRGEIIDDQALLRALRDGRCGGAGLDVAPLEPLPAEHPLWTLDNVVMTPHTAGASQLRGPRNLARFCDNLGRVQRGQPLLGLIDKQLGY